MVASCSSRQAQATAVAAVETAGLACRLRLLRVLGQCCLRFCSPELLQLLDVRLGVGANRGALQNFEAHLQATQRDESRERQKNRMGERQKSRCDSSPVAVCSCEFARSR